MTANRYVPTVGRAKAAIANARRFWRMWEGRYRRALMDDDPKGALIGIGKRRESCVITAAHWEWVQDQLKRDKFSMTEYRARTEQLRLTKTALELEALRHALPMTAERQRAHWHSIHEQE